MVGCSRETRVLPQPLARGRRARSRTCHGPKRLCTRRRHADANPSCRGCSTSEAFHLSHTPEMRLELTPAKLGQKLFSAFWAKRRRGRGPSRMSSGAEGGWTDQDYHLI